jgi:hypothetical protein
MSISSMSISIELFAHWLVSLDKAPS